MSNVFRIKRPCANCPWRKDSVKGWLGKERAEELARSVVFGDSPFWCHKTTQFTADESDEGEEYSMKGGEAFCAGALILEKKVNRGGNFAIRLGFMYYDFDYSKLSGEDLVFDSTEDFIYHHSNNRQWR